MNFGPPEVSAGSKVCQEEGGGGVGWVGAWYYLLYANLSNNKQ